MTNRERFLRVAAIFEAVRELDGDARPPILDRESGGDDELRDEVVRLLAIHDTDAGFLAEPVSLDLSPPELDAPPPSDIAGYRIIREIGRGGMGVVYLAEQEKPARRVAIKVIGPGLVSPESLRRFDVEAELLGRLKHPGIAQVYEAGAFDGARPFIAMELVEGVPLPEFVAARRPAVADRVRLVQRICRAVQHAHRHGVIHRDLKPGNILITEDGAPKILDFGVAITADAAQRKTETIGAAVVGTIGYMSPEQIAGGDCEVDTRTDVHALGVVLYELLAGDLPYGVRDNSVISAMRRISEETPRPLGSLAPTLRGDLEVICAKAIEKDKDRRYGSAAELADDLDRFLSGRPISARPPTAFYLASRFARRNRALVAASAAVLFSLVALLVGVSVSATETARQRDEAIAAWNEADAANAFLARVLGGLDPRLREGSSVTLESFLDDVADQIDGGALGGQPRVEATVRGTLGVAYRTIGRHVSAGEHLRRSIELLAAHDPANAAAIAERRTALGSLRMIEGDYERAAPLLVGSVAELRAVTGRRGGNADARPLLADALQSLAQLRTQQSRLDEAEALAVEAIELRRAAGEGQVEFLIRSLNALAIIHRRQRRYDSARAVYLEALGLVRGLGGSRRLDEAATLNNLALLYMYERNPAGARARLEEVLEIRRSLLPENHRLIGVSLNSLGGALRMDGDLDAADDTFREAIAVRRAALGDDHPDVATSLVNRGSLLTKMGRHDESAACLAEAIRIHTEVFGDEHPRLVGPLVHLGRAELGRLGHVAAESSLRRALSIGSASIDPRSQTMLTARALLARSLIGQRRFEEAASALIAIRGELASLPDPTGSLSTAKAEAETAIGELNSSWKDAPSGLAEPIAASGEERPPDPG